ncbi:LAQU0S04e04082g1_1 [Lachancea quebecensis]|uniref:LAQU0S04e04082g1_1 n=1 Tax=Lachancea quebecensis TaxID=1654605 RepID=A0A0P1KQ23_9SACH|nr:LAQU0S04e04082g1_1 [Lachancea quebecensis]
MLGKSSPFKKFGHSRGGSTEEQHSRLLHRRTASAGSQQPPVSGHTRNASRSSNTSVNSNFLAEQYERDRRAILNSCFSPEETTSQAQAKTYITHVRIIEDSRFPSSKPPRGSSLANKKKRVLLVSSLTNGGGMQLHKARENSNGSFQIGRTWALKELSCIEADSEQAEGFLLTMGKRYYWETNSAKERAVFIRTLVRVFMEDSGGHVPRLVNWDLSMFYLDESSYHKALIPSANPQTQSAKSTVRNSRVSSEQSLNPAAPIAPVKLPPLSNSRTPVDRQQDQNLTAVDGPSQRPHQKDASSKKPVQTPLTPHDSVVSNSRHSKPLEKSPYSPSKRAVQDLTATEAGMPHKQLIEVGSVSVQHVLSNEELRSQTPDASNFLSELNSVLTAPTLDAESARVSTTSRSAQEQKTTDSSAAASSSQLSQAPASTLTVAPVHPAPSIQSEELQRTNSTIKSHQQNEATVREGYPQPKKAEAVMSDESDLNDLRDEDFTELYQSASSHEEEIYEESKKENEDAQDLSFEKDDEVRYSQTFDREETPSHAYHEVTTIREEPPVISSYHENATEPTEMRKVRTDAENQAIMDILDDINWSIDDDSSELMYKLNNKLAETEYNLNRELSSLSRYSADFTSCQDQVLRKCEQLDPTLSFFVMELSTVSRDIEYVENQSNGLQVESANKKRLWKELSDVLSSVSVDESTLNKLIALPLTERNLATVEGLLRSLHTALKAIRGDEDEERLNLGTMRALRERRQAYDKVTGLFMKRVADEIDKKFRNLRHEGLSNEQLANAFSRLLMFSSLVVFCKDTSLETYSNMIEASVHEMEDLLKKRFDPLSESLKLHIRADLQTSFFVVKPSDQEASARFENNQTAKQFSPHEPTNSKKVDELVSSLLALEHLCITYQNFVGAFFHIGDSIGFEEYTSASPDPSIRIQPLDSIQPVESDRQSAALKTHLVTRVFQSVFNTFFDDILLFIGSQGSLLLTLCVFMENEAARLKASNQEFLLSTFEKLFGKFAQEWQEYIYGQAMAAERAIFEKGSKLVSPYARGFGVFVVLMEDEMYYMAKLLKSTPECFPESRKLLDASYAQLGSSMVKFLKKGLEGSAKNGLITTARNSDSSTECISLLLNSNWLTEVLPSFGNEAFASCIQGVKEIFDTEKERYAESLLRTTMSHLYSFVEGACALTNASKIRAVNPSQWAAYSQQNLSKILERYTSQEITTLIDKLYEHVSRDFQRSVSNVITNRLCDKLWSCIQGQTVSLYLKLYTLIDKHYKGTSVRFTKNEIITAFNKHKAI